MRSSERRPLLPLLPLGLLLLGSSVASRLGCCCLRLLPLALSSSGLGLKRPEESLTDLCCVAGVDAAAPAAPAFLPFAPEAAALPLDAAGVSLCLLPAASLLAVPTPCLPAGVLAVCLGSLAAGFRSLPAPLRVCVAAWSSSLNSWTR